MTASVPQPLAAKQMSSFTLATMVPLRRGGTNLFRRLLNSQQEVYSPFPTHLDEFLDISAIYGKLEDSEQDLFEMIVHLCTYMNSRTFRQGGIQFDPYDIFEEVFANGRKNVISAAWEMYRLEAMAVKPTARVIIEKSVGVIEHVDMVLHTYPAMKFLVLVRNPVDQVSSMTKAQVYDFHPLLNTIRWQKAHELTEQVLARCPGQCFILKFEELVAAPVTAMEKVADFLGVTFEPDRLGIVDNESMIQSKRAPLWKKVASEVDKSVVGKGKSGLTEDEIRMVESFCEPYMERYGYVRQTTGQVTITEAMRQEGIRLHEAARYRHLEESRLKNPKDFCLRKLQRSLLPLFRLMRSLAN